MKTALGIFQNDYNEILGETSRENKTCYITGDLNLNLMNHYCHSFTGEFLDALYSTMFYPLITCPTRITAHTATLIDNICTNRMDNHLKGGILFSDISDHLPVFSICFKNLQNVEMNRTVTIHHKNINNMNKFKERLADTNWS